MKWLLAVLAAGCAVGLVLLLRGVRQDGGGDPAKEPPPAPAARESAPPPPLPPRPAPGRPFVDEPQPEEPPAETYGDRMAREALARAGAPIGLEPDTGPTSAELAASAEVADRIEKRDAPANLRRIAMGCALQGEKFEGHLFVVATLQSGGGRIQVENLVIKDSTLPTPDMLDCVRTRLARASWDQPDAPDRRWRVSIPLSLPD